MRIYKNGIEVYSAESIYEIVSMITSLSGNIQSNYYDKTAVDRLISSASRIIQVSEMPANPLRNTLYYVGTTIPLDVILVDDNGTQKNLGTTSTDLSQYCLKTEYYDKTASDARFEALSNKVTSITSSSTDEEYPSAKSVYNFGYKAEPYTIAYTTGSSGGVAYSNVSQSCYVHRFGNHKFLSGWFKFSCANMTLTKGYNESPVNIKFTNINYPNISGIYHIPLMYFGGYVDIAITASLKSQGTNNLTLNLSTSEAKEANPNMWMIIGFPMVEIL